MDSTGDRSRYFPAIEKKHGGPISMWIERVRDLGDVGYPVQVAYLRETHGFSQAHANALVMYVRGSTSSKRFSGPDAWFAAADPAAAPTVRRIFELIQDARPELELVVAWNHPMLRNEAGYVIGASISKAHITLNPFSTDAIDRFATDLAPYRTNKKTFLVPFDWEPDPALLLRLVDARIDELAG